MSETSRRSFLTNIARVGVAAGIAGIAVRLIGGSGDKKPAESPCRACGLVASCTRPEGVRERAESRRAHSGEPAPSGAKGACGETPDPFASRWVRKEEA